MKDDIILTHKRSKKSFLSGLWKNKSYENQEQRRRRNLVLVVAGAIAIVVVASIAFLIVRLVNSASVKIVVAPTDATIMIGENQFQNGTYDMQPGVYEVSITRDGFESYSGTLEAVSGETVNLYVCLNTTDSTTGWYDEYGTADYDACQTVIDQEIVNNEQEWLSSDPILSVIPYHDYDLGYNIDYELIDGSDEFTVNITTITCSATRADGIYENALAYLRSKGIDTDNYTINRLSGCE